MGSRTDRFRAVAHRVLRRLMELSGERRVGPMGMIYGQTVSLRARTARFLLSFVAAVGSISLVAWLLFRDGTCNGVLLATEFAGTGERFEARAREIGFCDLPAMREVIWSDFLFAPYYTVTLGLFLVVWWNASWDSEPGFSRIRGSWFAGVALATLLAELVENGATLLGLHLIPSPATGAGGGPGDAAIGLRHAGIIFAVAWVKWLLIAVLVAATGAILLVWLIRAASVVYRQVRRSDEVDHLPAIIRWEPDETRPGLGICLSGGGIRSAAFGLGALSALEETEVASPRSGRPPGVLGQADLLASVSGGGYATSAWRLAVGFGDDAIIDRPIIGDPNLHPSAGSAPSASPVVGQPNPAEAEITGHLYPRLRELRGYMGNGRGGLLLSVVVVLLQMVWHLFLTLALIAILAWPLGLLIDSWIITTTTEIGGEAARNVEYRRLATPSLGLVLVLGVVLVLRSFTYRGRLRAVLNRLSLLLLGAAAWLFLGLVAVPWLVVGVLPSVPDTTASNSLAGAVIAGGVVVSVFRMVQAPIQSRARFLGGVLLLAGLVWFGLFIASQATVGNPVFAFDRRTWLLAAAGYIGVAVLTNPDLWSLHWLYRRRLAESFAHRWNPERETWEVMASSDHLPLSAYADAPGPKQVICAVAARGDMTNTGIPVVSMTFEPDFVTIHCGPDPHDPESSLSHAVATRDYERLFHGRVFAGRYRTVFCAAALSAAAVAPSLGRHSLGTTNTLIAALNLRLGVWMPNPMFRRGRRAGPDLFNMFRELGGHFDLNDPNVYVTDGGHWENLALVELIRRRAGKIISIDASGDKGFSFAALHEAIELAQLECAARIRFVDDGLEAMRPGDQVKAEKNWCRAEIHYPDGTVGRLLYVKAQASEQMPLDILRYSKEDPTFPNYSTADQLLREAEFSNLAILGRESMIAALDDQHGWLFETPEEPEGGPVAAAAPEPGRADDSADHRADHVADDSADHGPDHGADHGPDHGAAHPPPGGENLEVAATPSRRRLM